MSLTVEGQGAGGDPLPAVQANPPVPPVAASASGSRAGVTVATHPRHPELGPDNIMSSGGNHMCVTWPSSPERPS